MRTRVAVEDAELLDFLDRILDKGLFLGSANLLVLGQANLSAPDVRISVINLQTNTDSYGAAPRNFIPATRMIRWR
ncbi:MAG TPA: hypothetical protein VLN58_00530 [Verrucomicrobiae bacterium]|nr:hypothetical protein [Verrucomicrobiae bacterium]